MSSTPKKAHSTALASVRQWPRCQLSATIPEVVASHPVDGLQDWETRLKDFVASGHADPSLMGRFAPLVQARRIGSLWGAARVFGYPEAEVALQLEARGYQCWTSVLLFPHEDRPIWAAEKRRKTLEVQGLLAEHGFALPRTFRARVSPVPLNPDLVCYHPKRRQWLFCEVKRDEPIKPGQLSGLAVLHILTGAPACIVRLVPENRVARERTHTVTFTMA